MKTAFDYFQEFGDDDDLYKSAMEEVYRREMVALVCAVEAGAGPAADLSVAAVISRARALWREVDKDHDITNGHAVPGDFDEEVSK